MKGEDLKQCNCPYCERELTFGCFEPIFCGPCKIKFVICKNCGEMFNEKLKACPKCGVDRNWDFN